MARYIVTGGAGFIGSRLVRSLAKRHQIIVIDNFHTGSVENLKGLEGVEIIKGDSSEIEKRNLEADGIFHLGMYSSSPMYKKDPHLVGKVINDSIAVFEAGKRLGARVVFASTSSLYAGNSPPWKEDMEIKVSDYYCEARYAVERMAKLYSMLFGLKAAGLRFFSVYGPNERPKGIYANLASQFLWSMKEGKQPVIYGDGRQSRDFVYVDDVVRAVEAAMGRDYRFEIFNIGTGISTSMNSLVATLNSLLGTNIEPKYIQNPVANYIDDTRADCTRARERLGFEAKYTLEMGLKETISAL